MTAESGAGTVTSAWYVTRKRAVSWHGTIVRAWIAWHWLKR